MKIKLSIYKAKRFNDDIEKSFEFGESEKSD